MTSNIHSHLVFLSLLALLGGSSLACDSTVPSAGLVREGAVLSTTECGPSLKQAVVAIRGIFDRSDGPESDTMCTGTMIASNLILTARHCIEKPTITYCQQVGTQDESCAEIHANWGYACDVNGEPAGDALGTIRYADQSTVRPFFGQRVIEVELYHQVLGARDENGHGLVWRDRYQAKVIRFFVPQDTRTCNNDLALLLLDRDLTDRVPLKWRRDSVSPKNPDASMGNYPRDRFLTVAGMGLLGGFSKEELKVAEPPSLTQRSFSGKCYEKKNVQVRNFVASDDAQFSDGPYQYRWQLFQWPVRSCRITDGQMKCDEALTDGAGEPVHLNHGIDEIALDPAICFGDSGGPVVDPDAQAIVGVNSYGFDGYVLAKDQPFHIYKVNKCLAPNRVDVATDVGKHRELIDAAIDAATASNNECGFVRGYCQSICTQEPSVVGLGYVWWQADHDHGCGCHRDTWVNYPVAERGNCP